MSDVAIYEKMKDSKEQWLGDIPSTWNTRLLKYMFSIKKNIAGETGHQVLSVTQKGIVPKNMTERGQFSLDYSKYQLVEAGDFVMNHMDLLTGWVDISKYNGVTSPDYRVFVNTNPDSFDSKYYNYIFQYCYSNRIFYGLGQGVAGYGRWRLPSDMFMNFVLPVPPIDQQRRISCFLDKQCEQIDSIIEEAKSSIEEYKKWRSILIFEAITKGIDPNVEKKDSGIKQIGQIPIHWDCCSLKFLTTKIGSGKTPSGGAEVYTNSGIMFLRSQNIYDSGLILQDVSFISSEIDEEMKNTRVQYNDILLNITGGSIGRCCVYTLKDVPANVNQHVCIIRTQSEKLLPQFLRYFWNSSAGTMSVSLYQTGGNRPGLNFEQIGSTKVPVCSLQEQQRIVEYLDKITAEIDKLIIEKQNLTTDMENYKRSLTYEVISGKRKVV